MSYRFKGEYIVIEGDNNKITPSSEPDSPSNGIFYVDSSDGIFKVYNEASSKWIPLSDIKYGTNYSYAENEEVSSTNNTEFQEKLKLTTNSLQSGNYRIAFYFEAKVNLSNKAIEYRVQIDDTTTIAQPLLQPRAVEWIPVSGIKNIQLSSGIHTIDIDFRNASSHLKTAYIRNARLEIWRID